MKKISKEIREYDEWLDRKYAEREDKDNILPVGTTDAEFREWAMRILFSDYWYVVTPLGKNQINEVVMEGIIFQKCGMEAKDRKRKESKKEILNNAERTHLKRAIKPFRDKVRRIVKTKEISTFMKNREFILIYFTDEMQRDNTLFVILEDFEEGTMYKGMEEGKAYTIDELRL